MSRIETNQKAEGTEIKVYTDKKSALVVQTSKEERIYLPCQSNSVDNYYVEDPDNLTRFEKGYKVIHKGDIKNIQVLN